MSVVEDRKETDEGMTVEVDAMTVGIKTETSKVDALNEMTEVAVTTAAVAIGNVQNVKIQTSHSEPNATDAVHLAEAEAAGTVDLVETLEIDHHNAIRVTVLLEENFQNDHREERVTDLHAEMDATVAMSEEVRTEVRTIKVALEAMTVLRSANHVNLEPLENLEETARAMPITGLLNH